MKGVVRAIGIFLFLPSLLLASDSQSLSYNVGNTALFFAGGLALKEPTGGGIILPFHFSYQRQTQDHLYETDLIYRYDNHSTFSGYNETLLLFGKRFDLSHSKGWTWGAKVGFGYAKGDISNKYEATDGKIYSYGEVKTYRCFEGAVKLDLKKETKLTGNWNYQYGAGMLFIIPIACENTQHWSTIGFLVHRTVPVLDLSVNYHF